MRKGCKAGSPVSAMLGWEEMKTKGGRMLEYWAKSEENQETAYPREVLRYGAGIGSGLRVSHGRREAREVNPRGTHKGQADRWQSDCHIRVGDYVEKKIILT